MGKRSKNITSQEFNQPKVEEEIFGLPNSCSSKKHKKNKTNDDNNPGTTTGDDVMDTEVRSHKKKNKSLNNIVHGAVSDQEVLIKPKEEIKIEEIEEESKINGTDKDNAGSNKKKKKKRKFNLEFESDTGVQQLPDIEETKTDIKVKTEPSDMQIETSENIHLEKLERKKKKKIKVETAEETEIKTELLEEIEIKTELLAEIEIKTELLEEIKIKTEPLEATEIKTEPSENIDTEKPERKKKKKSKTATAEETEIKVESHDAADSSTKSKKKKNKKHHSLENQQIETQESSIDNLNQNADTTKKDKKKKKNKVTESELNPDNSSKKIKPVTAKFNAEEAAVTEEEINQYCDEIDEEDNKQYEEWVQLVENMLGPKKRVDKEP